MVSRNILIVMVMSVVVISIFLSTTDISLFTKQEEKRIFPGIIGDMILRTNETGISVLKNITIYDDFRGNITQGYRANYSGSNETMTILIAQMADNNSAIESTKDMVIRLGYNDSAVPDDNSTVIRLPYIDNPEVFVIQKKSSIQHYVFTKRDKVYWMAFSKPKVMYVLDMLREVYVNVDEKLQGG